MNFEIFANGGTSGYTSLVYVPATGVAHTWRTIDTTAAPVGNSGWFFTNSGIANSSHCGQDAGEHFCSLAEAEAAVPSATIISVGIGKGRDNAFQGAVDWLKLNSTTYDFEENGVVVR